MEGRNEEKHDYMKERLHEGKTIDRKDGRKERP
jgi:hypothetical protein